MFPAQRPRRLRRTPAIRRLVAETSLDPSDLVAPLFVAEGLSEPQAILSLPGHVQHTLDSLRDEVKALLATGVTSVILFGVPLSKDELGSEAWSGDGIAQVAIRSLKDAFGDEVVVMADLCVDEYTTHGHCGVVRSDGSVDNDATLELYAKVALAQVEAGADVVAPSGMMDGQVGAIRSALEDHGYQETIILAYAAKYASGLYGPFREAVGVEIVGGGNRKGYQQDSSNRREALLEARADVEQGADMVMVKPAMTYLDIVSDLKFALDVPVAAYHVSGEYAMVKAAAERGWIDATAVALEQLTAVRRAGADFVLTYFARELAEELSR
ncbi:MAG: delta-aminolevulinic acid dehydratase [Acidimicrobiaceae bacterium]|nr:delta-aminolevulinic acid dehydratase [Acidimicrobiaceae bacterium]